MLAGGLDGGGVGGSSIVIGGGGFLFPPNHPSVPPLREFPHNAARLALEGLVYRSSLVTFALSSCPNYQLFGNTQKKKNLNVYITCFSSDFSRNTN